MKKKILPLVMGTSVLSGSIAHGARFIETHGYKGCVELSNGTTRAVLEPNYGGRVLSYQLHGVEVLYQNHEFDGALYEPGRDMVPPVGGRFDIGPENVTPPRPLLWVGRWTAEITGERTARMTSQVDPQLGIQLVRDFELAADSSALRCTQTMINRGEQVRRVCHWSRTFAVGNGISLTPLNPHSRYPQGYIIYGPGAVMDYRPEDEPNIRVREGVLEILGPVSRPKFAIDASEGWLGYVTRDGVLFLKTFPVYPDRVYGEMAGNSVSIWYNKDQMCEVEPIGPLEILEPGAQASFTEVWSLHPFVWPENGEVDLPAVRALIDGG